MSDPYSLTLPNFLEDCPLYWQKFVAHVNPTGVDPDAVDEVLLSEHRAALDEITGICEFPSLSEYMLFLMKWS